VQAGWSPGDRRVGGGCRDPSPYHVRRLRCHKSGRRSMYL